MKIEIVALRLILTTRSTGLRLGRIQMGQDRLRLGFLPLVGRYCWTLTCDWRVAGRSLKRSLAMTMGSSDSESFQGGTLLAFVDDSHLGVFGRGCTHQEEVGISVSPWNESVGCLKFRYRPS